MKDDLAPVLKKVEEADALILGSPIYFSLVSGEMRSFMERLLFPYLAYTMPPQSLFPKKIPTAFIYTMNVTEELKEEWGYQNHFDKNQGFLELIFGTAETLCVFDTCQFDDYAKVLSTRFDPVHKAQRRREVFPRECERAFDLGARLAGQG